MRNTIFHTCPVLYQYEAGNDCQCRKSHGGENYKVSDSTSISLDSETYQNNFNIDIDLMNHNSFTSLMVCFCRAWKDLKIPIKTRSFNPLSVPIPIIDKSMQINVSYLILYQVLSIKQKKKLSEEFIWFRDFPKSFLRKDSPLCNNYYLKRNMSFSLVFLKTCRILFASCKRIELSLSISSI